MQPPLPPAPGAPDALGLGLDAGGTQTRWALTGRQGLIAEGHVAGMSGMQLASEAGRAGLQATLAQLASDVQAQGQPAGIYAGITGLPDTDAAAADQMRRLLAEALQLPDERIRCCSDMDIAFRAAFAPGQGYLVYAGTGSIAAFIDELGQMHRAGGRGPALGDDGGGYWIACQALAQLWRAEDERPGAWRESALAQRLLAAMGGDDWALTRQFVYGGDRGAIGALALQVAASAEDDPAAHALLLRAGAELARLAQAMQQRFGPRPVALAGRALQLHPLVLQGFEAAAGPGLDFTLLHDLAPHRAAATLAIPA